MVFQALADLLGFGTQDTTIDDVGSQTGARLAFDGDLCAAGTTPNKDRTQCVVDPSVCANGTLADGLCTIDPVFDSAFCAAGTTPSNNECVAELACGPGTKRVGDQCVVGCEDGYVLSEDHVCAKKPWPEFERCSIKDFLQRPDDRLKGAAVCPNSFAEFDNLEKEVSLERNRMIEEINELKKENRDLDNEVSGLESKASNLQNKVNNLERQKAHIMKKCSSAGPTLVKPAGIGMVTGIQPAKKFKATGKPIAISIRSKRFDMKYCTDAGNRVVCTTPRMKQWETFQANPVHFSRKVLLKGGKDKKWCQSTPTGLKCDVTSASKASAFEIVRNSKNAHALRTADGKYCAVENDRMICNRDHFLDWESLSIRPAFTRHLGGEHKRLNHLMVAEPLNGYSKKFIVNPGQSDKPKVYGLPSNDLAGCQALARRKHYAAVGFRTEAHPGTPSGRWKNSCFYYTKADPSFQGNDADAAHQVACANEAKHWPHC